MKNLIRTMLSFGLVCLTILVASCSQQNQKADYTKGGEIREANVMWYLKSAQADVFTEAPLPKTTDTEKLKHTLPNYLNDLSHLSTRTYSDPDIALVAQQNALIYIQNELNEITKADQLIKVGGFPLATVSKTYTTKLRTMLTQMRQNIQEMNLASINGNLPYSAFLLKKNKAGTLTAKDARDLYVYGYRVLKLGGDSAKKPLTGAQGKSKKSKTKVGGIEVNGNGGIGDFGF